MSKVIVIGGSFAGLTGALEAKRKLGEDHEVVLISRTEDFVYIPSLIWVPFGWREIEDISIPIRPILDKAGVGFIKAEVTRVEPELNRVITSQGDFDYDYLLVASGVSTRFDLVEGLGPEGHTYSVCTPGHAREARAGWEKFLQDPGPVVVGATQGASCMGAGYEFLFNLEYAARKAGVRDKVDVTWITPEPFLGHFGIGGMAGGEAMLKGFMKMFNIRYVLNSEVDKITETEVVLKDQGKKLPYKYAMIIPPFNGARFVKESGDLGDEKGFLPVDDTYRHKKYGNIFGAGLAVAVPPPFRTPVPLGVPKTGYPSEASAKIAAHNIANLIKGSQKKLEAKPWGKIPGLCVMDAGRKEVVIISNNLLKPRQFAVMIPNPLANIAKRLLEKYFLWKTRKGLSYLA